MPNSCHPFGYDKVPDTCKWCGVKLRKPRYGGRGGLGVYGRGHFHSDSCAVSWAHRMAELGQLLVPTAAAALALVLSACSALTGGNDLSRLNQHDAGSHEALDGGELEHDAGSELEHDAGKPTGPDRPVVPLDGGELERDGGKPVDVEAGGELEHDGGELEHDAARPLPSCDAPSFSASAHYSAGDDVQAGEHLYRCKPVPAASWCELDGYEPGSGTYWRDAWLELGACTSEAVIPGYAKPWTL